MEIICPLIFGSPLKDNCLPKWPIEDERLGCFRMTLDDDIYVDVILFSISRLILLF
jgi:hypothetical protein